MLAGRVEQWRQAHYPHEEYGAIGEILSWAATPRRPASGCVRLNCARSTPTGKTWNTMRKKGDVPNKLDLIELRTDPQYGHFFEHQPARAQLSIKRAKGKVKVTIQDFISPSILERLKQQAGILSPQIDDWRAMVVSVMIDSAYDGYVFNIALADVPERKTDLVSGGYELDIASGPTTVAVQITDMLGEDVLEVRKV